ncbi:hypothetical protein FHX49_001272 [Microbacterium endophyticum]|uniref:Uncharacterized protein n=1 Tax=Microbacterium endophyticum TaxID=1526412 RepID=A0A7W4V2N6_9MICO|nr:hypothetical protein [Microbacterium endophyticum]MBB2975705.1 hypothetical protein [Microbacterium endophyticum]NIK36188.1 hypothetical protein [Microbacterium endophyticum]
MVNLADALMRGPRGRRLCLEYASRTNEAVRLGVLWLGKEPDPNPRVRRRRLIGDVSHREEDPTYSGDEVAALIEGVDLSNVSCDIVRESLQATVDFAYYWQEPDDDDHVAAEPAVRASLWRVAERLATAIPELTADRREMQWAVEWPSRSEAAWRETTPFAALAEWAQAQREGEARAAREGPADPHANVSGMWWSLPYTLLTTRGSILDALELTEDFLGWETAAVVPVEGAGKTLEIRSPEDWADLCREYPMEVTASRRHDWFRVTGRDGRWVIPDWQRVSEKWDAVHLTTLGYLSAATQLIDIDKEYGSVIAGWGPDSTIWLTEAARKLNSGREQWIRPKNDWHWTRAILTDDP